MSHLDKESLNVETDLRYVRIPRPVTFEVQNAQPETENQPLTRAFFSISQEYFNGLPCSVTVVDRNGLLVEIPASNAVKTRDFIIRVCVTIGQEVKLNIDALSNSTSSANQVLAEVIEQGTQQTRRGERRATLDYHVSLQDIEDHGGSLYLSNLDIVASIMHGNLVPFHPHSEIGIRNRLVEEEESVNSVDSFGYALRIVDSFDHFGDRYVNINSQVYKVPVVRNSSMPDGVYLTSSGPVAGNYEYPKPISRRYHFDEADEKLRLYRTAEDARALGDQIAEKERALKVQAVELKEREQRLKEEKAQRDHDFELQKQEIEREKAEDDARRKREDNDQARRLARLKDEVADLEHRRNVAMIHHKDAYEHRALERKETGELVKLLPTLITGAFTLFIAFSKFSK